MLILAAFGACLFIAAAGWLHYSAAAKLNESRDWIEHSQSVVSTLQMQSQRLDRIESSLRLFQLTRSEGDLRAAESNVAGQLASHEGLLP